jgi:hypothetical protein
MVAFNCLKQSGQVIIASIASHSAINNLSTLFQAVKCYHLGFTSLINPTRIRELISIIVSPTSSRVQKKFIKALFEDSSTHSINVFLSALEKEVSSKLILGTCEMYNKFIPTFSTLWSLSALISISYRP